MKAALWAVAVAAIFGYAIGAYMGGDNIVYPPDKVEVTVPGPETTVTEAAVPERCQNALHLAQAIYEDAQSVNSPYKQIPTLFSDIILALEKRDVLLLKDAQTKWNDLRNEMIPGLNAMSEHEFQFRKEMKACLTTLDSS